MSNTTDIAAVPGLTTNLPMAAMVTAEAL